MRELQEGPKRQAITTNSSGVKTGEKRYYPWGTERYTYGTTPTTYRYTGQRAEFGLGLMYYGARWYDPSVGRFIQADTIVPGGVQGLDRYAYTLNNPIRYIDPTGHFTEDEVCKYWGYCDEEAAREGLGELFSILWKTKITWGDTLLLGDENGISVEATFILVAVGGNYSAALWNINEGKSVSWDDAKDFTRMAAYNEENNVWEAKDINTIWGGRSDCESWYGGGHPKTHLAKDLFIAASYKGDFFFTNYLQFNGLWYLGAGLTIASLFTGQWYITVPSAIYDISSVIIDVTGTPFQGPVPIKYPILQYDPLHWMSTPWQIGLSAP